ncbi:MAG: ester cyclase [Chloroflexi bacterium]|nr:ester cyclase [Chloroflexota bacterium]
MGKRVTFSETHIVRIVNGKAIEHWGNQDDMAMMQQLGVIPEG